MYSCDGVVLAAEGSLHIRTGKVILTSFALVVEECYFDLTVKTTIPLEAVKVFCFFVLFSLIGCCFCFFIISLP